MTTKEEDVVENVMIVNSHSYLLMFTSNGKVYMKKAYQIPEASRTSKGTNIVNIIDMDEGEKVTAIIAIPGFEKDEYFVMVTKYGVIKRAEIKDFEYQRKGGKIAINLDEGDELLFVCHTTGKSDIVIATHNGKAVRFAEEEARVMGRTARGVRGIKLKEGDYVIGAVLVDENRRLVTITEKGYGKLNNFEGYTAHSRGTTGVICHRLTEKTGALIGISTVCESDDIVIITNERHDNPLQAKDIPVYDGNSTSGVIVMRLSGNASVANFEVVKSEEEEEKEILEAEEKSDTEKEGNEEEERLSDGEDPLD